MRVRGHVDSVTHQGISGWIAADSRLSDRRYVRVFVDGVEIGTVRADQFRPDILSAKISDGYSGFSFRFPSAPDPLSAHKIEVVDRDTGRSISGSPKTLRAIGNGDEATFFDIDGSFATGHIRWATYKDNEWTLELELLGQKHWSSACNVAHGSVLHIETRTERDPFVDSLGIDRKICQVSVKSDDSANVILIDLLNDPSLAASYEPVCRVALPATMPEYIREIGEEHMKRVSGRRVTPDLFAAGGTNTAHRIESLLRRHFQKGFSEFERILDWGAGCGRVSLPILKFFAPSAKIVGADVDEVNIALGRTMFPQIEFIQSPFYPPLPMPDRSFDAAFGISVVTHLTEGAQFAWLKEIRRIVKPGAPVILTVHGEYALFDVGVREPRILHDALKRGFCDYMLDMNLGPKLSDKAYYRATYHTRRYVYQNWAEHFEILGYYSCGNVLVQDFVVLRAKD